VLTAAYPEYSARLTELLAQVTKRFNLPEDWLSKVDWGGKLGAWLVGLSGSLISFMSTLVMVVIFLVFLLLGKPDFKYKLVKAFSKERGDQINQIVGAISSQIGRYLAVQFVLSFATGLCVWLALYLLGVDFAVTWGALAFFLNFIPNIGSIIASVPPILLALIQYYPNWWPAILSFVFILTIQMVIGNVISPKVMGDRLNLSPVVILFSLLLCGYLWGVVGALLSVPIASIVKIVCANIEPLRVVSVMMGSGEVYRKEVG